jgi:hypothetical protein
MSGKVSVPYTPVCFRPSGCRAPGRANQLEVVPPGVGCNRQSRGKPPCAAHAQAASKLQPFQWTANSGPWLGSDVSMRAPCTATIP